MKILLDLRDAIHPANINKNSGLWPISNRIYQDLAEKMNYEKIECWCQQQKLAKYVKISKI